MSAPHERVATLEAFGAPPTRATAVLVSQNPGQRAARALGVLIACWAAAVVAVFIPLAHFFLVPGFAVLGVVWAVVRARERERLLRLHGVCPRCHQNREFGRGSRQSGQTWVTCPGCFTRLAVRIESRETTSADSSEHPLSSVGSVR